MEKKKGNLGLFAMMAVAGGLAMPLKRGERRSLTPEEAEQRAKDREADEIRQQERIDAAEAKRARKAAKMGAKR